MTNYIIQITISNYSSENESEELTENLYKQTEFNSLLITDIEEVYNKLITV